MLHRESPIREKILFAPNISVVALLELQLSDFGSTKGSLELVSKLLNSNTALLFTL